MSSTKHFKIKNEKAFILGPYTTSNHKGNIAVNISTFDTNHLKLFEVQVFSVHHICACISLTSLDGLFSFLRIYHFRSII